MVIIARKHKRINRVYFLYLSDFGKKYFTADKNKAVQFGDSVNLSYHVDINSITHDYYTIPI